MPSRWSSKDSDRAGRPAGVALAILGLCGALYFGWATHRAEAVVMVNDGQWPRGWPYPDTWLSDLNHIYDLRHPLADPHCLKLHGEFARVRTTISFFVLGSLMIAGAGLRIAVSAPRSQNVPALARRTDPDAVSAVE
jgi:hypothetical protein